MILSEKTIQIVKSTAPVLAEHGEAITQHFYQQMFSQNPELLDIFNATNQKTGRQQHALAAAVYGYAAHIDDLGALSAAVQRIAHKHASFNILPEHYPIVGKHLLEAVAHVLGDAATDEIVEAWTEAYGVLANIFIEVEEGIYRESETANGGWRGTREFHIAEKTKESELITSFVMEPVDGQPVPDFQPGQYIGIYLQPESSANRCIRQYSLSDAPNGQTYRISVKREGSGDTQGLISHYLHNNVNVGDVVELSPPSGDFYLDQRVESPVVLISGGVGQTPMLSMLNTLIGKRSTRQIHYVHSAINSQVHGFADHVHHLAEKHDNLSQTLFYDAPTEQCTGYDYSGPTDLNLIRDQIDLPDAHFYFCGPLGYMSMVSETLKGWNVPVERIHFEVFGPHKEI
ncbi:NO-inducible flavohemoprotein [Pontibacterium granulatum]|uniref:NO-inducible flavohemoprotein n=1 Tax=Pontibacterium granulatum TaxID=2036029 RepID=UPI00249A051E|nr:NO-inducible flavohemoprotein [Pontibacterium granulatum]MDI3324056.1 NO-inducible flavohemoprotein [Pontibacterium granulatum]